MKCMRQPGMMHAMRHIKMVLFIAEDGTDLLALFKEKSKNGAGYELYSKRWLQYAKMAGRKKMIWY